MATISDSTAKEIRRALMTCVPYLIIVFFLDDLDKFLYFIHSRFGNPLIVLYLLIATIIIIALFIHEALGLRENYRTGGAIALLPVSIYLFALLNSFWSPVRISSEVFHSKVSYQAFRKQKYGYDKMKMRENGNMDISYKGPFGISDWEYGRWHMDGDTFYLYYDRGSADTTYVKPDTLVKYPDGMLTPVGIPADTLQVYKDRFFSLPVRRK
jgi:hypothetical protein